MAAGELLPRRKRVGVAFQGLALVLALLVGLGPTRARAEKRLFPDVFPSLAASARGPRVVVLVVPLDKEAEKKAGLLEGVGERAVETQGRFDPLPLSRALDPSGADARHVAEVRAEAALKEGQKTLDDLDAKGATLLFQEAIDKSKAGEPGTPKGFDTYVQAQVMRVGAMVALGNMAGAKAELEKILVYAPKAQLPDAYFPPELIKLAETQRKAEAKATGTIVVRSEPSGARVTIDGVFRGYAPVTASGYAPGNHLAVAQLGGYQTVVGEIPVSDQTVKLKPVDGLSRLQLAREKVKRDPYGPGRDQALRDFGRLVGADQVLLVLAKAGLSPGKLDLVAERLDVTDGHNLGYRTGPAAPTAEGAANFLGSVLLSDEPRAGGKPVAHFGSGGGGGSGRTVLAISLLGVAAVALGTGIFCGVQANDRVNQYKATPQVQTRTSANLASEGKTFAVIADVSYLVALAAAAGGTTVYLTGRSKGGASEEAPPPEEKRHEERSPPPEDQRKADEARKADERRKADEARKAEEQRKADEQKKKEEEEEKKAEEERKEKEKHMSPKERRAEERRRKEEERKAAEEAKKEEKRRKEEERKAEEQRKADEAAKEKADADAKAKADADAKARAKADADAKAKADAEAKSKADADAKAKADADAKAKADADAKAKADADAKARSDADAKAKADAAARAKADADAKRKADESEAVRKEEERKRKEAEEKKKKDELRKKQQQDDEDLRNQ